jgi:hypothetical protein
MAGRPGFVVDHFVKAAEGGWPLSVSPNQYADVVSVQMRCNWPPLAPKRVVRDALVDGFLKALRELEEMRPD